MVYFLDTNIVIWFLIGDDEKFLAQSKKYFQDIENSILEIEILEGVLMEALICAKSTLQGYGKLNFDNDVKKC